jgi:hypothetical protein
MCQDSVVGQFDCGSYIRKLITNDRVARYLEQYQPELFIEFQKIAEMTSTLPSEAA